MVLTIDAVYDGQVFRPVHPLTLPVNIHVQIAVTTGKCQPVPFWMWQSHWPWTVHPIGRRS